jgi:hypothetical protein
VDTRVQGVRRLDEAVAAAAEVFARIPNPEQLRVNREWSAKDALGHLVFWHESFARNVSDVARAIPPTPLKGTYAELGLRCLEEMRPVSSEVLIGRLLSAQAVVRDNIMDPSITAIPYRRGSRDYSPEEHLAVVADHIDGHVRRVMAALG